MYTYQLTIAIVILRYYHASHILSSFIFAPCEGHGGAAALVGHLKYRNILTNLHPKIYDKQKKHRALD